MGRACEYRYPTVSDGDDGLFRIVRRVTATRTDNSAGRVMVEEFGAISGRKRTERTELFEMVLTPNERDCQLIEQQERDTVSSW